MNSVIHDLLVQCSFHCVGENNKMCLKCSSDILVALCWWQGSWEGGGGGGAGCGEQRGQTKASRLLIDRFYVKHV